MVEVSLAAEQVPQSVAVPMNCHFCIGPVQGVAQATSYKVSVSKA